MVIGYRLLPYGLSRKETSLEAGKLLKQLVAQEAGVAIADISLQKGDNGAPQLSISGTRVYCSISHKNNFVVAAYSAESPIGVDVENLESNKDYSRIREHYADGFLKGVTTKEGFFYRWTLAEAYTKASGRPLLEVLAQPFEPTENLHYTTISNFLVCTYVDTNKDNFQRLKLILL
ncbi:phosphopantetheinyl transferase related enzyme [Idiomarina sp.]|uniref:4'-phosphopantetheinyl transferase family protein n=1 Tax=Idiomarina sp. TaxID=1874361 RepID=UPI00261E3FCB|nr:phosphopantetheinyl transferase related enzyme [Idiomarina sp.]